MSRQGTRKQPDPVEDPAYRDVDPVAWRPGRLEERIRRTWNPVRTEKIRTAGHDLDRLTEAVHEAVGGDRKEIHERLEAFLAAEETQEFPPAADPLLRPGAQ